MKVLTKDVYKLILIFINEGEEKGIFFQNAILQKKLKLYLLNVIIIDTRCTFLSELVVILKSLYEVVTNSGNG